MTFQLLSKVQYRHSILQRECPFNHIAMQSEMQVSGLEVTVKAASEKPMISTCSRRLTLCPHFLGILLP
jgi:hypothetical protein